MVKDFVCYKKNCWSTKHSVIDKAEKTEDEHAGEDLNKRITPHSHGKQNEKIEKSKINRKDGITRRLNEISKIYSNIPINNQYNINAKKKYDHEEHYLISGQKSSDGKEKPVANFSRGHNMLEYAEFLIEFPQGRFRVSNFYRGTYGELKKKGFVPDYTGNVFDQY